VLKTLDLDEYRKFRASDLSGGNKRKLSVAMTLLVYPVVEFLDEPTCGVDPVSRKHLFQMIKRLSSSAVLMTTHRMEEAERLCDLIAIMVNGSIVCYGSPTYLMETYGGGYEVICAVDMGKSNENEVRRQLWNKLP